MKGLVLIDIQENYSYCKGFEELINNSCEIIKKAMDKDYKILIVELKSYGIIFDTVEQIKSLVRGYDNCEYVEKLDCNGSIEVMNWVEKNDLKDSEIFIGGLFGGDCVKATCNGIMNGFINGTYKSKWKMKITVLDLINYFGNFGYLHPKRYDYYKNFEDKLSINFSQKLVNISL